MKKMLLSGLILMSAFTVFGQTIRCGYDTYLKQLKQDFPEEYTKVLEAEVDAEAYNNATTTYKTNGGIYTIPVVVHIVYSSTGQNIDDEFVFSQLEVLNEDFRRLNPDADDTPAAFEGDAGDAQIEFCLAQQDPNGVIHSGITRTETDITSWSLFVATGADNYADNVKFTDKGGEDAWPRAEYLNIWVCNMTGGILGYATPPGGVATKDGVVIGYKYFGVDGAGAGAYDMGRTATHEVGHWLSLKHIWGDDDFAAEPQCSGSDGIDDTPNQEDATYGSPSFPLLDDCSPSSPGIQFMNFMDYTDDAVMNMFSNEQIDKMRGILESSRSTVPESIRCEEGGVDINEVLKNKLIQLTVYPNPSKGEFIFQMKNFENKEITVEIYNLTGELINRILVNNTGDDKVVFDAGILSAGDYLVKASDGEFILTQKITVIK